MKTRYLFIVGLIAGGPVAFAQYDPSYSPPPQARYAPPSPSPYTQPAPYAQQYPTNPYPQPAPGAPYETAAFSPAQLDQLVSPIALYPDPLLGAILPASTYPDQVAAAANFDATNMDPAQIDQQPWDDSVKTLAHYPTVAQWMAQNANWTQQLGTAVATDEQSVFSAIQQLRANARASGMLVDTPQQRVVVDQNNQIEILPAQADVVYVPTYNPQWIESASPPGARFSLSFGPAFHIGDWDRFDLDWDQPSVWIDRSRNRDERHGFAARQPWEPPREMRDREAFSRRQNWVARPQPFNARGNERRELAPTGRVNSPAMEYNQPSRERQPEVQYDRNGQPRYHRNYDGTYNRGQPQVRAEHDQRHDARQNTRRHEDRRDRRDDDDD